MQTLAKQVLEHAAGLPEGTPLAAKELLHLGSRAAVDQVLSRLVQRGALLRACRVSMSCPSKAASAPARRRPSRWLRVWPTSAVKPSCRTAPPQPMRWA